jgi:hypothetical protein
MMEELKSIADQMNALLSEFRDGGSISGLILPTEFAAMFRGLAIEAKSILDDELGRLNEYSLGLLDAVRSGTDGPSFAAVEETEQVLRAAIRALGRKRAAPPVAVAAKPYVDPARIAELHAIGGSKWDFTRLLELCRELNLTSANRCHMATAMLLRTVLNHVPPALGFNTFDEVANNYGGEKVGRSFKAAMLRLQESLRSIADMHLHSPIRDKEVVPTAVQVDFAAELDLLLSEIVRISR